MLPLALLGVLGANWGLAFSLAKIGSLGGVPPLGYALWLNLGAGVILTAMAWLRGEVPPVTPVHLRYYLIAGVAGLAIPTINVLYVVRHLPAGIIAVIVALSPLLTYGFAQLYGIERFDLRRASGIALGLAGVMMIVLPRTSLPSPDMASWALMTMITPLFYAGSNIYVAEARPAGVHSLALAGAMQLGSAVVFLPLVVATDGFYPLWPHLGPPELAILGHIAVSCIGSLLFFEIIRMAGPVFLSQVGYLITLTGLWWGHVFFDERHSLWVWAATATILLGLMLVTRIPKRPAV
ncbi:MAG: DMT family transporter [Rhodospirillales bacterium]|nr:DMT family transporter [Rhodospirillales bacterium]